MPFIKQATLRAKAFSKVYVPYHSNERVPARELYDRDGFEAD